MTSVSTPTWLLISMVPCIASTSWREIVEIRLNALRQVHLWMIDATEQMEEAGSAALDRNIPAGRRKGELSVW